MAQEINWELIDKFRKTRMHLTTGQIAQVIGVSRMTYWRWVNGRATIPYSKHHEVSNTVRKVLKAGVTEGWKATKTMDDPAQALIAKIAEYD